MAEPGRAPIGHMSRRALLAGAAATLAAGCGRGAAAGQEASGRAAVPLSRFGVDRFSTRDQWSRLSRAFEAARAEGIDLVGDPDASYRRDGPLLLDGVSLDGRGCALVALSDGHNVLRCIGRNWRLANLRVLGAGAQRSSENLHNGIWVGDHPQIASDFALENVMVDAAAPGRGVAAAGIMFTNAHRGRIVGAVVRHSLADGIHVTGGSTDLRFERVLVEDSGDDGFAVVSYRDQGRRRICRGIRVADAVSRRSAARGFAMVGALDTVYERVRAEASAAAGIYLYGEGGFDTYGVVRCQVLDPVVVDCASGRGLPPGFSNAAIILGGRDGTDVVDGVALGRGTVDCLVRGAVVEGGGAACTAAISTHQYAIRPRIVGARVRGTGRRAGARTLDGIEVGGRDVVVEAPVLADISGLAVVVTKTASGTCVVQSPQVTGSRLHPGPINSYIYAENAPALRRMDVRNGRFTGGPDRLDLSLLPAGRLALTANRLR